MGSPDLFAPGDGEGSAAVAERVERARARQRERFRDHEGLHANAQMGAREVRRYCEAEETGLSLLRTAMGRFGLSARTFHRVLKLARTIGDLEGSEVIRTAHVAEAIQYRGLDRSVYAEDGV